LKISREFCGRRDGGIEPMVHGYDAKEENIAYHCSICSL